MPEEKVREIKEKKKWQPINIILGLLIIGSVFYFYQSQPPFIALPRLIPTLVLIFTRKNNVFSFLILFLIGLTVFFITTFDGFLILGSAVYMFISTILRMFRVKKHAVIGLAIVLILGLGLFWEYTTTFVSESKLIIIRKINNENSIELVDDAGKISTTFYFNRGISPRGEGLQKGTYVYQVVSQSKGVVVPMSFWPIFKVKANGEVVQRGIVINWLDLKNVALHGGFNQVGWFPLALGDYTIQLVKIEKPKGIIVAESNFSIAPYDKQILSKLTAYLAVDGDPNKYYDSYTKKGKDSVTVWVQSPPGEVLSGTVKSFIANSEGEIDKTSWIGVSEDAFRTDINGEPVPLRNLSGNPPPGIYHYQILIDGQMLFDLKYNCF
ncbi:MAG: hypothetical protein PHD51_04270 [Patescibacteria group bacterium]|nr:hypothetical protein [Patescibacteria group bacterium]MDD5490840.1 hypothetical protein [Patescibacteria group bacterium]